MSVLSSMDLPTIDVSLGPEKIEDEKVGGPMFHCDNCDTELVHKLAQMFMPALASACVDNTTGLPFKTPGSVAVDLRKEMTDYLNQRSESFVAESIILEGNPNGEVLDHPFDIISHFVDEFVIAKRNLVSQVSGWLLSERREDKIDDFFCLRVSISRTHHCSMSYNSAEELASHDVACNFRTVICENEGCNTRFCAGHQEKHDSTCPFKIIPCEQKCSDSLMRRDMDRHRITVCPMKIVNCLFYRVGCRSTIAQCVNEKHCSDDLHSHLLHMLKGIHKEASAKDLNRRVAKIIQASPKSRLAKARDVRSFKSIVKDLEAKLRPMEVSAMVKNSAEPVAQNKDSSTKTKGNEQITQVLN